MDSFFFFTLFFNASTAELSIMEDSHTPEQNMTLAGILSDTHLTTLSSAFEQIAARAFEDCEIIFHAGDLTDKGLLEVFQGKTVYAVHGNMCNYQTQQALPKSKIIKIHGYTIGLCHGAGPAHNIEERMWSQFAEADCIIYGHTHRPVCEKRGGILFINPGSFHCTSSYGTPASYAIMKIESSGLEARLHRISQQL